MLPIQSTLFAGHATIPMMPTRYEGPHRVVVLVPELDPLFEGKELDNPAWMWSAGESAADDPTEENPMVLTRICSLNGAVNPLFLATDEPSSS